MKIGPSTSDELRISHWDAQGLLIIDMSWDDWDELVKDAEYFRKTGRVRGTEEILGGHHLPARSKTIELPPER
jgi:hypothetical protein